MSERQPDHAAPPPAPDVARRPMLADTLPECGTTHHVGCRCREMRRDLAALDLALDALRLVDAWAEADILAGNPIEGAHHRAQQRMLAQLEAKRVATATPAGADGEGE